jgi:single-strand DNA-binding protein
MANLNKVMLIGRLTRDPETRAFSNGGKVARFGFAVNNRKKNPDGSWGDEPVFLDCEAFNRGENGTLADRVEQTLRKGQQIFSEGHLKLDQRTSQEGQKRSMIRIVVDNFQYLERREEGAPTGPRSMGSPRQTMSSMPSEDHYDNGDPGPGPEPTRGGPPEEDIPF